MKILKSNIFKKRKCAFGEFELRAQPGWKISQSFIDLESGLLVVLEYDLNRDHWKDQSGFSVMPNQQHIVDATKGVILDPKDWSKYFDYQPVETYSDDGKLKVISTRKHVPERNNDEIWEELIDVESGQTITTSKGTAFRKEKRTSLIEKHYKDLEYASNYKTLLRLGEYPDHLQMQYEGNLSEGDKVFEFYDEDKVYNLSVQDKVLVFGSAPKPKSLDEWNSYSVEAIQSFEKVNDFWMFFSRAEYWFETLHPRKIDPAMHCYIIEFHNGMVHRGTFTYAEFKALSRWMNMCWDETLNRNVYWQFCAHCRERVHYYPRYPKHACKACVEMIKDEEGNDLDYIHMHELKYMEGQFHVVLKGSDKKVKLYLGEDEYVASEARFGGVVHQKLEKELHDLL